MFLENIDKQLYLLYNHSRHKRGGKMKIKISNLSSIPIYQQIASEIRNKILSNELMSNTQLPSIRALSKELEVGIITIKKAYEVLLQENLIYSKGAVGYFVNEIYW